MTDLTQVLAEHLDRHLVLPLLEFLLTKNIHPKKELLQAKYALVSSTGMVDVKGDVYKLLHATNKLPAELAKEREQTVKDVETQERQVAPILAILQKPEVIHQIKSDKDQNLAMLQAKFGFKPEYVDMLSRYAKLMFEIGKYDVSAVILTHLAALTTDFEKSLAAAWGRLASEILFQNWETAWEELMRLRDLIENTNTSTTGFTGPTSTANAAATTTKSPLTPIQLAQQRTWIIHWSLFVFFKHPKGRDAIVDMFFQPVYLLTIQTACPHILRYLAAAVITNKRRRSMLKELVKIIQQELYAYRDPITDFVNFLYNDFDFDGAQKALSECEEVLANDYFLSGMRRDFIENARYFMFESYCRIHQRIDIRGLSQKLNLPEEEGERWIVNLIRNARLDAKIDSQARAVVMGTQNAAVYQDIIEKTKELAFRSHVISSNMDKKEQELAMRLQQQKAATVSDLA